MNFDTFCEIKTLTFALAPPTTKITHFDINSFWQKLPFFTQTGSFCYSIMFCNSTDISSVASFFVQTVGVRFVSTIGHYFNVYLVSDIAVKIENLFHKIACVINYVSRIQVQFYKCDCLIL